MAGERVLRRTTKLVFFICDNVCHPLGICNKKGIDKLGCDMCILMYREDKREIDFFFTIVDKSIVLLHSLDSVSKGLQYIEKH